jgi:catechol 2,3-dioxygenase-like lactoylglutathione lyase family enzyme
MPSLNAVGIVASDMARTIAFYRVLGLDVPETPDAPHVEAVMENGFRLMLDQEATIHSFNPGWKRATGNQVGLAIECDSAAQVDELHAAAVAAGFDAKDPFDAFWGQRYCELKDPDGNPVDLFAWV